MPMSKEEELEVKLENLQRQFEDVANANKRLNESIEYLEHSKQLERKNEKKFWQRFVIELYELRESLFD